VLLSFHLYFFCFFRDAQGVILMYDVTRRDSFQHLQSWLDDLNNRGNKENMAKMIIANKIDLPGRVVSKSEGLRFAEKHGIIYIEESAKLNENVTYGFELLAKKVRLILSTTG
jgi:Ras-related protein Rab-18